MSVGFVAPFTALISYCTGGLWECIDREASLCMHSCPFTLIATSYDVSESPDDMHPSGQYNSQRE
jgi:hypothetical protein